MKTQRTIFRTQCVFSVGTIGFEEQLWLDENDLIFLTGEKSHALWWAALTKFGLTNIYGDDLRYLSEV